MTQRRDLQALIDAAPVGKMQWRVIICCFLVVMLDGFDTAAIGFIAPDIRTHWQLTAGDLAPLFGAGLLGLTAGALLGGPMSDRFTLGSAFGGIVSAQLVPVIGWHGILVLGGVLPLMLFVALLVVLPESPRWQVRRQLPQAVIAKTVSAITRERYVDTHFYLIESASVTKGSIRQLFMGRQLPITLMLWVVFFMSLLIIYLLSSWMPTLLNHRGIDLQHASWVTAAFQIGGTLGALALGVLMDKFNPFRVLALSYATGAICIVMIGLSQDGLWLMALAIFGTGIGISGSQVGLNALTATLYPTQSRATGVSWSNAIGRCGAIVGSLSGGVMMAMNFSFDTLFFIIAVPAAISAVMLTLLITVVRQSTSVPDSLPRAGVVNE